MITENRLGAFSNAGVWLNITIAMGWFPVDVLC